MLAAAVGLLILYLAIAPWMLEDTDYTYQTMMTSIRGLDLQPDLKKAIAESRANPATRIQRLKEIEQKQVDAQSKPL